MPFPDGESGLKKITSRKKIWERELPKGQKKERQSVHSPTSDYELLSQENGLPFPNTMSSYDSGLQMPNKINTRPQQYDDYFALGGVRSQTKHSFNSKQSVDENGKKILTAPKLSRRMDRVYELGKHKLQTRSDADRNQQEYDKQFESCTFKPRMSEVSKKMGKQSVYAKQKQSELKNS